MPAATSRDAIGLRPVRLPEDLEFLYRVYASTRQEELAPTGWSEAEIDAFLRMQFQAQDTFYRANYPTTEYQVISCDGHPVGRLYVDCQEGEIQILDIALLPEARNRGIGGLLLRELIDEGRGTRRPVRIYVEVNNPALRLYQRLGFTRIGETGIYDHMEWSPANPSS